MLGIPNSKGPLPVQVLYAVLSLLFIQMNNDLRIRLSMKSMPLLDEIIPQFDIVENLSIEGDPDGLILIAHRLTPTIKVKDAQPRMA